MECKDKKGVRETMILQQHSIMSLYKIIFYILIFNLDMSRYMYVYI